jgi:transcriptional regulator GlxA family with amidase domain
MINIAILALKNATLSSITDSKHFFEIANEMLIQSQRPALFNTQVAAISEEVSLLNGLFSIQPEVLIKDIKKTDLVIIPAITGDMIRSLYLNKDYVTWISQQYKSGAEIAGLSQGVFLLAYSGLLKYKNCTTHWYYANDFKKFYPSVKLVDEKIYLSENGLYSCGGGIAYWNLLLFLVEKYTDRALAIQLAKYFVIDLNRDNQSPFSIFKGVKTHEDQVIAGVQDYIEKNYFEKLNVSSLAGQFNLTRRTFERRFKKATYITVADYIQRVKIEAAKKHLEIGRMSISDVMLEVGYLDIQNFRDVFKDITKMTPIEYRNKYNKDPSV